jgi:hypothetical protein
MRFYVEAAHQTVRYTSPSDDRLARAVLICGVIRHRFCRLHIRDALDNRAE